MSIFLYVIIFACIKINYVDEFIFLKSLSALNGIHLIIDLIWIYVEFNVFRNRAI